jgi:hypothetical protein
MNASERKRRLRWLKQDSSNPRVLTNARCLTEGVDVPSLDGIVFADPRRSQVDIVQAVGRVMRSDPDNPDKIGRIVIPVVVPDADQVDGDNVFEDSAFKPVWDVVRALKAHDFRLDEELNRLRGLTALGPVSAREFSEGSHLVVIGIKDLEEFQLAVLERTTANFWWMLSGPMAQFTDREGHARLKAEHIEPFDGEEIRLGSWASSRRGDYAKGKLSKDRIDALEALPVWVWNPFEADYQRNLAALRQFVDREGYARVPRKHVESFDGEEIKLGLWIRYQRSNFAQGELSQERIAELESLPGWQWNPLEDEFQQNLAALKQFAVREGHVHVPPGQLETFGDEKIKLGMWVSSRRRDYVKNRLSRDRINALEVLPGWVWDPLEFTYERSIAALRQFVDREGHARVPNRQVESFDGEEIRLGSWVGSRRGDYAKGKLSKDRIDALEALPGWEWDLLEADFKEKLAALSQYVSREGRARISRRHVETFRGKEILVGKWASKCRVEYAQRKLSQDRIDALGALPGWEWDPLEGEFQRHLAALKQFAVREGHVDVPRGQLETFGDEKIKLGQWVRSRRSEYSAGGLSQARIEVLENVYNWEWVPSEGKLRLRMAALRQFVDREGYARVPRKHVESFDGEEIRLGSWVGNRRRAYAVGTLSQGGIESLEAVPGWEWDQLETDFQGNLAALKQFVAREGHAHVSAKHVETFDGEQIKLGGWVSSRRKDYSQGKLSQGRIDALEALPGWVWKTTRK